METEAEITARAKIFQPFKATEALGARAWKWNELFAPRSLCLRTIITDGTVRKLLFTMRVLNDILNSGEMRISAYEREIQVVGCESWTFQSVNGIDFQLLEWGW